MSTPDLAEFLDHLAPRDEPAAWLACRLLESGWSVFELTGPVQMDVWQLLLEHGPRRVRFGIERGRSDGVLVRDDAGAYRPILDAMGVNGESRGSLAANRVAALNWLNPESDGVEE
ncbi:hypothetical protein [Microbacterium oxydans]|uniref:hypothetical protein n=1 Tax=Microbacterium oxydans TaxID=82380 RepID=UPI00226B5CF2|nr:hypothetical protein [Microbacterium oxydans]WAA66483.1 hypothetical protein MME74_01710 [Microbacterium oxydans]